MVRIEVTDAVRELRRRYADIEGDISKQIAGALNHTARKAKTAVSRNVRAEYNIKAKDIKAALKLGYARVNHLETYIEATGRALPLRAFPHRQTRQGVSVSIMKKRYVIKKAFVATMRSGHKGVFARGGYGKRKFNFRYQRTEPSNRNDLQINELYTTSIPSAIDKPTILNALAKQINSDFPTRLSHLLGRTSKFGKIK
jgi:hypothetical protein